MARASDVLNFWKEAGPEKWFAKDDAFDASFKTKFYDAHFAAARGECDAWLDDPESALALILLLDQFPRNCFRKTGHMFATDGQCLKLAKKAIEKGHAEKLAEELRVFVYLPLMHSENLADQERCVELCKQLNGDSHHHAVVHRDIIKQFGRFPHRNRELGRDTTPEEQKFLDEGGFSG